MSSAFRRAKASSKKGTSSSLSSPLLLGARGVKPWAGGIHLTSAGLSDLDTILGGGQPLGTCILVEEDRWTRDLGLSIVKYWCAEAVSQEQCLLVPVFESSVDGEAEISMESLTIFDDRRGDIEQLLFALPRNLHWDKQRKKSEASNDQAGASLEILEEGGEDDEEKVEEGLDNAWQYRKSVQQERLGQPMDQAKLSSSMRTNTSVFCHSYDLSGRMHEQSPMDVNKYIAALELQGQTTQAAGFSMFRELVALLKKNEGKVTRLLLFHPDLAVEKRRQGYPTLAVSPRYSCFVRRSPVAAFSCTAKIHPRRADGV
eukprot:CAMPEP_0117056512 /NCGR_PEP_ID=MMETSP0472-20121206/39218_1 /TAXON_ID=693140 ORGANISM="Tiarina fusus, Strain LIS" /NCGR_SAMPLE_ID=MMETSP0472 /ASSEMBLY_ACC=CAM_ASM_000603 /LENGTH=314 /DNA_ID=CAMNT_0004773007 /DNA_START=40 /DNA_END=981 /DNA_ORIENTATION=+